MSTICAIISFHTRPRVPWSPSTRRFSGHGVGFGSLVQFEGSGGHRGTRATICLCPWHNRRRLQDCDQNPINPSDPSDPSAVPIFPDGSDACLQLRAKFIIACKKYPHALVRIGRVGGRWEGRIPWAGGGCEWRAAQF